jgi:hypothetical protein
MVSGEAPKPEQTAHQPANSRRVRFEVCCSFLVATVRCRSAVYQTESAWQRVSLGVPYALASLALGPWGLPWGPIWTLVAVWINLTGGVPDEPAGEA